MLLDHFLLFDQKIFSHHLFLFTEENIMCVLFAVYYLQIIKQKVYLLPENLDQLSNLNIQTFQLSCGEVFETFVILSGILLPIKSPVALSETILRAYLADCLA